MPPPPGKLGNICVWLVTVTLFLSILAGGTLLVLYVTLPESEVTVWLPAVGMVLVCLPWLFWIMTCFYRTMTMRGQVADERSPIRVVPAPAKGTGAETGTGDNTPVDSPGGKRKVHFVLDTDQEDDGVGDVADGKRHDRDDERELHITTSGDDESSLGSRESEIPFARSRS